jgi:histidinol-phosphate aminotransferase
MPITTPASNDQNPVSASRRAMLIAGGIAPLALAGQGYAAVPDAPLFLALNECAWPPSPGVERALAAQFGSLARYADPVDATRLTAVIARIEGVTPDQIVLGDVLEPLGRFLATKGGTFVYSSPGYTALIDAAQPVGGRGVAVPLDARLGNDLAALARAITPDTRALFLVNPHNPSGTVTPRGRWHAFLTEAAKATLVIVDEAYIEYDVPADSAVALTRDRRSACTVAAGAGGGRGSAGGCGACSRGGCSDSSGTRSVARHDRCAGA